MRVGIAPSRRYARLASRQIEATTASPRCLATLQGLILHVAVAIAVGQDREPNSQMMSGAPVIFRRKRRRDLPFFAARPPCLVAMEACPS